MSASPDTVCTLPLPAGPLQPPELAAALPLARVEFELRQLQRLRLPHYAGSMLRGAFGHALRRSACVTRMASCAACPLYRSCAYPELFETPTLDEPPRQVAHPYVIEPPAPGARELEVGADWSFAQVLVGRAIRQLPLVIHAWRRAAEKGFGAHAARAELRAVYLVTGAERYLLADASERPVIVPALRSLPLPVRSGVEKVQLQFLTPLRLQDNGRILGESEVDAPRLLTSLARRVQNLIDGHGERPLRLPLAELHVAAANVRMVACELDRFRWTRFSSRQQRLSDMTGLVGTVELQGDLAPFAEVLGLGEMLHVGKGATFGLGRYCIPEDA